ncbi:tRNA-specific adenosine deaminase [compost metagenome]
MLRNNQPQHDEYWIQHALRLAKKAAVRGEVPVAAVIVGPEGLVSWAINTRERQQTPLGHAELLALHKASQAKHSWRLEDCTLYVTLEPCVMCAGAIQQSRIPRIVYGALDPKGGAHSLYHILEDPRLNHQCEVRSGVLEKECSSLLTDFFAQKRESQKKPRPTKFRERATAVILFNNKILGFKGVDPTTQKEYIFLPGGGLEPQESAIECASRESQEETGYRVRLFPETEVEKKYNFDWDGQLWACRTLFYLGTLDEKWHEPLPIQDAAYNKGVVWVDVKDISKVFNYTPEILAAVQKLLKKSFLLRK